MGAKPSNLGDLTAFAKRVEALFEEEFSRGRGTPAMAICFTLPPHYDECHWVTNVSPEDGIKLFLQTATKMTAKTN